MNQNPTVKSGRRRRVSTEQKRAILQQRQAGTPVPEPATLALVGMELLTTVAVRRMV